MQKLIAATAALALAPTLALSQEVPDTAERDLWCGTAFQMMEADMPGDAGTEQVKAAQEFAAAGNVLVDRALPIYLESGYSDAALATLKAEFAAEIAPWVKGGTPTGEARYSYEECALLAAQ